MNICPKCHTPLQPGDLPAGSCPACHAVLAPAVGSETVDVAVERPRGADDGEAPLDGDTVEGQAVDMTIDVTVPSADGPDGGEQQIDQTLDPHSDGTVAMPGGGRPEQTIDAQLPSDRTVLDRTVTSDITVGQSGTVDISALQDGRAPSDLVVDGAELPTSPGLAIDQTLVAAAPAASGSNDATATDSPTATTILVIKQREVDEPQSRSRRESRTGADYDLLELLGQGGMGMVYAARQASIDRTVAFKMIKAKNAAQRDVRDKFLSEACVTGELEHPNIVPIYDVGRNSAGAYFYAMKRVQGTPWNKVIAEKSQQENLEILMKVSDAVAFAHFKGIVHRDLKPENVMLGGFGEVLVMDWGLAIPTDPERRIGGVQLAATMSGTPSYMAPEMVMGPFDRIAPTSDIYLLGAILYEITTGLTPHTGKNVKECLVAASKNVIQPAEQESELIDIALRAMELEPADRYQSVGDFQDAIRQYQSHSESIALAERAERQLSEADGSSEYEHFSQAVFGFQQAIELWPGNERAVSGLASAKLKYATAAMVKGDLDLASGLLDRSIDEHAAVHEQILAAQRERDARQQRLRTYKRVGAALITLLFVVITVAAVLVERARRNEARQRAAAVAAREQEQQQRMLAEEAQREEAKQRALAVRREQEATAAREQEKQQRLLAEKRRQEAEDARSREQLAREAEAYEAYVARIGAAVSKIEDNAYDSARALLEQCIPDGPSERDYRNWEWGRLWYLCQQASRAFPGRVPLESIAYSASADGAIKKIAVAGLHGQGAIWSVDGRRLAQIDIGGDDIHSLAYSPDGQLLVAGTADPAGFVKLLDGTTGSLLGELSPAVGEAHTQAVLSVAFSLDGRQLVTGSRDGSAKVWDMETRQLKATLHGHRWWVWQAEFFAPDPATHRETKILTVSQDGTAIVWSDETGHWADSEQIQQAPRFDGHDGPVYAAACSPDGRTIATAGHDQRILLWDIGDLRPFDFQQALAGEAASDDSVPVRTFTGHTAAVRTLAFARDGRRLISGGHDNTIRIWSVEDGQTLKTLRGHGEWVRSCALSPDGQTVMSAGFDQVAYLWDIEGYAETRVLQGKVLEGHEDSILAAAFSTNAERIVTASRDRTIKTWASDTGEELMSFREGHAFLASHAEFFDNGRQLATAAVDNTVRIWDAETGSQMRLIKSTGRGAVLAVSPDGTRLLTGGPREKNDERQRPSYLVQIWDVKSGTRLHALSGHAAQVSAVAYSPDGRHAFSADTSGLGILWNARTGELLHRLRWHQAKVIAAHFLADNRTLVTAALERAVAIWNIQTGQVDETGLLLHPTSLVAAHVHPVQPLAATVTQDNHIRVWNLDTAQVQRAFNAPDDADINDVSLSPDGRYLLISDATHRRVHIFDGNTGEELLFRQTAAERGPFLSLSERSQLWGTQFSPDGKHVLTVGGDQIRLWELAPNQLPFRRLRMNFSPHGVVATARYSTDGSRIVSGSWDGTTNVWEAETGATQLKLVGKHSGPITCALFSPDPQSRYILTASTDSTAVLWEAERGEFLKRFAGHKAVLRYVCFSPDLSQVLTAAADGMVGVWDIDDDRQPLAMFQAHSGPVNQAAFSSDGTKILTGGSDNTAKTWDAASARHELTLVGHTASVTSVAFAPDGKRVLTGSEDFQAKLWDSQTGKELLTLNGHQREVTSVSISSDQMKVLTSSHDGTAIMWMATPWDTAKPDLH